VASGVALDMLHWAMPHVSLQHLHMVINMACDDGDLFITAAFFAWRNHS
jgi:hypothetical protein